MIEQLWYTWTSTGIRPGIVGAQIRAASPGLMDFESERVRNLDRYLRYYPPRSTYPSDIIPEQAPISLAFLNTGQEQILLIGQYTGKDGFGRPGAFFIHLLAGLPITFSARDAVLLWNSGLWANSEFNKKEQTELGCLPEGMALQRYWFGRWLKNWRAYLCHL